MAELGYRATKRLVDVLVAAVLLVAVAPLLLALVWAVRRDMGSPVLFRQARLGRHGVPFDVLKLRTMRDLRPGEDQFASDAARLTRLGAKLRSWSLDEIPQLVNVLKGDMSLIGPRPLTAAVRPSLHGRSASTDEGPPGDHRVGSGLGPQLDRLG